MRTAFALAAGLVACSIAPAVAQRTSLWLEANGSHSRPPSGTTIDPGSYGLFGARLRVDSRLSVFEAGATAGRGANNADGSWLSGRAAFDASRARGRIDFGLHGEAGGLTYLSPVQLGGGNEYEQSMFTGTLRPQLGLSIAGVRLGVEAGITGGKWRAITATPVSSGPGVPIPGRDPLDLRKTEQTGDVTVIGGAASLLRVIGPATLELRASHYDAKNQVADGRYAGVDGTLAFALGRVDLTTGARYWSVPNSDNELGGHVGLGFALGDRTYLQAIASQSVSDPVYGTKGGLGFNVGLSMRVGGGGSTGSRVVNVGAAANRGRSVRFTLEDKNAKTVAVAGDFNNWQPHAMQRTGNTWTFETVLAPGAYHFSFVVDGTRWMVPDDAPGLIDDGWGRKNATVIVSTSERQATE